MGRVDPDLYSVSHSEMETFKDCKRRWMLQYHMKLRRKSEPRSVARDTGVLVHEALHEFYMLGGMNGEVSQERTLEFLSLAKDTDMNNVREDQRKATEEIHIYSSLIVKGYFDWLEETGADLQYDFTDGNGKVLSEVKVTAPGPVEGTQILGILDLGGTHRQSGDLVVMDTKVVGSIPDMVKTLGLNEQGPMYALLSKVNEPDLDRGFRVVWNMLVRNKRTARANPPFYQRYELSINPDQLKQFYTQLHGTISDILRTEERLNNGEHHAAVAYPHPTKDCTWKCPYMALCSQMNDPRSDPEWTINQYFTTPAQRAEIVAREAEAVTDGTSL